LVAKPVPAWREPASGKLFVGSQQSIFMSKAKDPNKTAPKTREVSKSLDQADTRDARLAAEKDILKDPDLSDDDPTDDLDEAELAQRDNSDEEAFDALEKSRPAKPHAHAAHPHPGEDHPHLGKDHPHSGKGNAK
jgi:hypothetical protein